MRREGNNVFMDKADLIRMNQLVRGSTDYERFQGWYLCLSVEEQAVLIGELCQSAYQAGVDECIYELAARNAGLSQDKDFLRMAKMVKGTGGLNISGLVEWLRSTTEENRDRTFRLYVYLFGEAERRVLQREDRSICNHWWHRNLTNPQVVESIMNDPEHYKTSPRDDETLSTDPEQNRTH